jgi:hypothetical protein
MPGAEARSRRPAYRTYKRVRDAQNFARKLGVGQVDYGRRIDIANLANHGLFLAWERGVPMPAAVRARAFSEEGDSPDEIAYYQPALGDSPGEMGLNSGHPAWGDPDRFMREAAEDHEFSTTDPRHFVVHEMGELAMHQSVGSDRFNPLSDEYLRAEEAFQGGDVALRHIYAVLGNRASVNHGEFVAEMFTALVLGRAEELRRDEGLMDLYERYGGEGILQYDR